MEEIRYECITVSCCCLVRGIDSFAGEDLSVVSDGRKFGLIHRDKYFSEIREEGLLPCVYDNLYFLRSGPYHTVVVVENGKLGLFTPEGSDCRNGAFVEMRRLLPSIFDRFEPMQRIPGLVVCYKGNECTVYDIGEEKMSRTYNEVRELSDRFYLGRLLSDYVLCCVESFRETYRMDEAILCSFAGKWCGGDVYMLTENRKRKRLLFCDRYGEEVRLSPIAADIRLHGFYNEERYFISSISMDWTAENEAVDDSTIFDLLGTDDWRL